MATVLARLFRQQPSCSSFESRFLRPVLTQDFGNRRAGERRLCRPPASLLPDVVQGRFSVRLELQTKQKTPSWMMSIMIKRAIDSVLMTCSG